MRSSRACESSRPCRARSSTAAVRRSSEGVPLKPIIRSALNMGDELHSRNTAATLLFIREMFPLCSTCARRTWRGRSRHVLVHEPRPVLLSAPVDGVVRRPPPTPRATCRDRAWSRRCASRAGSSRFASAGSRDRWFTAPIPAVDAKLFDGYGPDDIEYMGGESTINETVGLGGFAQAAAFPLQDYQGGSPERHDRDEPRDVRDHARRAPRAQDPLLRFRGIPVGIDVHKVVATGITPVIDIGVAGKGGGQIGAGVLRAPIECFTAAAARTPRGLSERSREWGCSTVTVRVTVTPI